MTEVDFKTRAPFQHDVPTQLPENAESYFVDMV